MRINLVIDKVLLQGNKLWILETFVVENPSAKALLSPLIEASKNNLTRLQNYLLPRLRFLETVAIMSVRNQYSSDNKLLMLVQQGRVGQVLNLKVRLNVTTSATKKQAG